ncbi:hypothetical protein [Isoptericola sp. NPDC058082]|uniref:hypothetical protein n=1 Tax=Isoptericola sp. NPDC058082 TaxID=3346331 RepID=UPI0036EDE3CC
MNYQPPDIAPEFLGTPEHPNARDLSNFLVHLTSDEEALGSILANGILEAREPHGFTKSLWMVREQHLSTCLTEMPLTELPRMRKYAEYGIAFRKDFVRAAGGQRVWYLDEGSISLRALNGIKDSLIEESSWDHSFWNVTPYVDLVAPGRYSWEHEREWRVVGGLAFQWRDVALVIAPSGSELGPGQAGIAVYDPTQDEIGWWGGEALEISAAVELLAERFDVRWMTADEAGIPWSSREGGYQNVGIALFQGSEAVEEQYAEFPAYVRDRIRDRLAGRIGDVFCVRAEVASHWATVDEEHRRWLEEEGLPG